MKKAFTRALWLPIMVVALSASYCKDETAEDAEDASGTQPFATQIATLADRWQSDCIENNSTSDETIGENGFYNETLEFVESAVTQTYTYYQDANCSFPVENQLITEEEPTDAEPTDSDNQDPFAQVNQPNTTEEESTEEEAPFVATISRIMDIALPRGTTPTDLGRAYHIDLETTSIAINDEPLTDEQMLDLGIEVDPETALEAFIGLFLISANDQLHLSLIPKVDAATGLESARPTNISLTTYYTRIGNDD